MPDSFIDIAVWFTIVILAFNVFAIWVNETTESPYLKIAGWDGGDPLSTYENPNFDANTTNTIGSETSEVSQQRQAQLLGYEDNIFTFMYNLLFMWQRVLTSIMPPGADIIATMLIVVIGIIESVGILALLMRLAVAIGALIPFT